MTLKEKEQPIYKIKEDDQDKPLYIIEDDTDETREERERSVKPAPINVLFKIMFTPVEGWKALKRGKYKTDDISGKCFYPLIALAAVCDVAAMFYEANFTFSDWAISGLTTFITFFFGYFTVLLAGSYILPLKTRGLLKLDIGKQFVMMAMSTLSIFYALTQLIPMLEPVLVFLPVWTIYLIFKGVKVLRIPQSVENSTTGYLCLLIIGAPLLWFWLFTEYILPIP